VPSPAFGESQGWAETPAGDLHSCRRGNPQRRRLLRLAVALGPVALLLGLAVSLDELAIGFTLGLLRLPTGIVVSLIAGNHASMGIDPAELVEEELVGPAR
jgi:hypothetical protein